MKCCKGVELIPGLYSLAKESLDSIKALASSEGAKIAPTSVIMGDILKTDWWSEADIVYCSSVCFPEELNEGIGALCAKLKPGSRVLTLKAFRNEIPHLDLLYCVNLKMTWGFQPSIIYIRNNYNI